MTRFLTLVASISFVRAITRRMLIMTVFATLPRSSLRLHDLLRGSARFLILCCHLVHGGVAAATSSEKLVCLKGFCVELSFCHNIVQCYVRLQQTLATDVSMRRQLDNYVPDLIIHEAAVMAGFTCTDKLAIFCDSSQCCNPV